MTGYDVLHGRLLLQFTYLCPLSYATVSLCHCLQVHHEGFQPDFDDFTSAHVNVHAGCDTTELGGAASAHRLIPDYYVLQHVERLWHMKPPDPANLTLPLVV